MALGVIRGIKIVRLMEIRELALIVRMIILWYLGIVGIIFCSDAGRNNLIILVKTALLHSE